MRSTFVPPRFALLLLTLVLSLAGAVRPGLAVAQEGTPAAAQCVAPELPPGTPTPPEASPEAMAEMEVAEGTPVADEDGQAAHNFAPPEGLAADDTVAAAAIAGADNFIACLNAGNFLDVGALMSNSFIVDYVEVDTVYDIPADMEGVQPVELISSGNVLAYDDGRVSVDLVFTGFFYGPGAIGSERWTFVLEEGFYKLDNITWISGPAGLLEGAVEVDVTMVDFAFSLSQSTIPANVPVILHVTNNSFSMSGHVAILVTCQDITPEQIITGEKDGEAECAGFFGASYLEPGQTSDFLFSGLPPGRYIFACDVETPSGVSHIELGMVAEFVVE